jgi:SAM-dependent methyltransferase
VACPASRSGWTSHSRRDLDLSLVDVHLPNLEFRKEDIVVGPVEPGSFDLVTARAVLHHVADADKAIANLIASLRPGGAILLIEPDFLPVTIAEPPEVRAFWSGWLAWSRDRGIDYQIGRTLAPRLAALGLEKIGGIAESVIYNGTSLWAGYWTRTIKELRQDLTGSGKLDNALWKRSSVIAPIPPGGRKRSLSLEFTVTPLVRE